MLHSIVAYYEPIDVLIVNMGTNDIVSRPDLSATALAMRLVAEIYYILANFEVERACFVEVIERYGTQCFPRRTAYFWGKEVKTIELAERWFYSKLLEFNLELFDSARQKSEMELLHYRGIFNNTRRLMIDGLHINQRGTAAHCKSIRTWIIVQSHKAKPR